jgi:heme-degrading monooxygenase HmoA
VIVREFQAGEGCEQKFEKIYGPGGKWNELLQKSEGFISTELKYESVVERRYKSFDHWRSHSDFEAFREGFQAEIEQLKRQVADEELVESEFLLGSFYIDENGSGFDEDTGLVPA